MNRIITKNKMFSVAVIGTGFSEYHISLLLETKQCQIKCLGYGENQEKALNLSKKYSINYVTNDINDILSYDVDMVVICTPVLSHYELCKKFLEKNIIVICDKPLCISSAQAKELASLASSRKIPTMTFFQWRMNPGVELLKHWVSSKDPGQIREIHLAFYHDFLSDKVSNWPWRHSKKHAGAGVLADLGIHLIDLSIWLLNETPEVQTAYGNQYFRSRESIDGEIITCDTEDILFATLYFPRANSFGSLSMSRVATGKREISISMSSDDDSITMYINPETGEYNFIQYGTEKYKPVKRNTSSNIYQELFDHLKNNSEFTPSFKDGARAQNVFESIMKISGL